MGADYVFVDAACVDDAILERVAQLVQLKDAHALRSLAPDELSKRVGRRAVAGRGRNAGLAFVTRTVVVFILRFVALPLLCSSS